MKNDTDIIAPRQQESVDDPLTEIARDGARRMLAAALRAEADTFVAQHSEEALPDGRQRIVRHGHGPERNVQTGIGVLDVRRPKVRERAAAGPDENKIRFTSAILPKWARRSRTLPHSHHRPASYADHSDPQEWTSAGGRRPTARARNDNLSATRYNGLAYWNRWTGYHARSRIEAKKRCLKSFGERFMARDPDRQTAEIHIRIALMNRFSVLGNAEVVRVA